MKCNPLIYYKLRNEQGILKNEMERKRKRWMLLINSSIVKDTVHVCVKKVKISLYLIDNHLRKPGSSSINCNSHHNINNLIKENYH